MNHPSPNTSLVGASRSRERLATPALLLDLDAFERNLDTMSSYCREARLGLRPHAKTHKCTRIARLQQRSGAMGISVATVREATAMVHAGVAGVLVTSPIVGRTKIEAFVSLVRRGRGLMAVVDNAQNADELVSSLRRSRQTLPVLIDVDVGMKRTGVPDIDGVLALARRVSASDVLKFAGIQCYSGIVQHIPSFAERSRVYGKQLDYLQRVIDRLSKARLAPAIVSGGGTGTFDIDRRRRVLTECQPGSYVFMDVQYGDIELFRGNRCPFKTALFVQSAVCSNNHRDCVTVDAGFKSFATDGPVPRPVAGAPAGARYLFYGDEFGMLRFKKGSRRPGLGAKVEFITPHCDPTVNLHDFYHCVRGNRLTEVWPIDARGSL